MNPAINRQREIRTFLRVRPMRYHYASRKKPRTKPLMLAGVALQRARWLTTEMRFAWCATASVFYLERDPRVRIPLSMVAEAQTSYATFQRAVLIVLQRAGLRAKRD